MARISWQQITSAFNSITGLNANFQKISDALDNTLVRDGSGENQMESDLNMNHFEIQNVDTPSTDLSVTNKLYVDTQNSLLATDTESKIEEIRNLKLVDQGAVSDSLGTATNIAPSQNAVTGFINSLLSSTGLAQIGTKRAATNTVTLPAKTLFEGVVVSILEFGAKFDVATVQSIANATDDSTAWEQAVAYLVSVGGGTLTLPPGGSKTTRMISIPMSVPIRIIGSGRRKVYPGVFTVGTPCPSTLVPVHTDRCALRFIGSVAGQGAFCAENFNLATFETGPVPTAGFGWETQGGFLYGFSFNQVGVHGFTSAFDVYKTAAGEAAVGAVSIRDCTINRNLWICRTLNSTQFNGFHFYDNKAGQNGTVSSNTGGISISGHNIGIVHNILEGQNNPITITGGYKGLLVYNNYFEANTGVACINVSDVVSYNIGPNNYGTMNYATLDHKVLLQSTGLGTCVDPFWSQGVHKTDLPLLGISDNNRLNNTPTNSYGFYRFDRFGGKNYGSRPDSLATFESRVTSVVRDLNPQTGAAVPFQQYTTTGSGIVSLTQTLSGSVGQWVVVSIPFRRIADANPGVEPFLTLNINNTGGAGTRDLPGYNFLKYWREGEWVMLTAATQIGVAMTSLGVYFYPFGINPVAGRVANFGRPYAYVVDDINKVVPFLDNDYLATTVAAPTTGTWAVGDTLRQSVGGFFVCTTAGTPGTWKSLTPA